MKKLLALILSLISVLTFAFSAVGEVRSPGIRDLPLPAFGGVALPRFCCCGGGGGGGGGFTDISTSCISNSGITAAFSAADSGFFNFAFAGIFICGTFFAGIFISGACGGAVIVCAGTGGGPGTGSAAGAGAGADGVFAA